MQATTEEDKQKIFIIAKVFIKLDISLNDEERNRLM